MLLIALLLSERKGRGGGGWRDNVKETRGGGGRGGTVHCTALIIALEQRWEKEGRE